MRNARYSRRLVGTSTGLAVQVAFLAVLGVGGARVAERLAWVVGDLIAFLLYSLLHLPTPIAGISPTARSGNWQAGIAAVHRLQEAFG